MAAIIVCIIIAGLLINSPLIGFFVIGSALVAAIIYAANTTGVANYGKQTYFNYYDIH